MSQVFPAKNEFDLGIAKLSKFKGVGKIENLQKLMDVQFLMHLWGLNVEDLKKNDKLGKEKKDDEIQKLFDLKADQIGFLESEFKADDKQRIFRRTVASPVESGKFNTRNERNRKKQIDAEFVDNTEAE